MTLAGASLTLIGMTGPFIQKWTRTQADIGLGPLLAPIIFVAVAVLAVPVWAAIKAGLARLGSLFSRQR